VVQWVLIALRGQIPLFVHSTQQMPSASEVPELHQCLSVFEGLSLVSLL